VVAVSLEKKAIPGPGPSFVLEPSGIALVVGSVDGVHAAARLLAG
jgi:K+/H+ antiporter YhaU regulatory subunit KhtT